ncbi:MAG: hypothetical protein JNM93_01815 [Bacteriovoracaceae bacterium]|nr:hypothetical protein [Bacteriovoracaceae bacterium]
MKKKIIILLSLPVILVLSFIFLMHLIAMNSGFKGYRGGQQDALRHTLASAYVSKYISPKAVDLFTLISERDPTAKHDKMDIHNNRIGKRLGPSLSNVYSEIKRKVEEGNENATDENTITWLPKKNWVNF